MRIDVLDEVEVSRSVPEHPDNVTDEGDGVGDDGRLAGIIFDAQEPIRGYEEDSANERAKEE